MMEITAVILVTHVISPYAVNMVHLKYVSFHTIWLLLAFLLSRIHVVCIMI